MITVIGTAHISQDSIDEVREKILELKPDIVAVELCEQRYRALVEHRDVPILELVKGKNSFLLLSNILLSFLQRKLGEEVGVKPGEEMLTAVEAAREVGASYALIDRDIRITLGRATAKTGVIEKLRVLKEMFSAFAFSKGDIEEEIEELKKEGNVAEILESFRETAPNLYKVLVGERDAYMAKRILSLDSENVVVVVGAGHKTGVENYIQNPDTIPDTTELLEVPKGLSVFKVLKYALPALIVAIFLLAFQKGVPLKGPLGLWILNHALPTFLAVLLARGSLAAAGVGMLASPLTSLNPLLAAGWFAGLTEMKVKRVTVGDVSEMFDATGFRELYRNRAFTVLLVTAFANLGSLIGTFISFPTIILPMLRSVFGG
ncbi:MAG: TraB/GumN family protein [Candidatus Hydrothermarchaeales archaeon]